MARSDRSFFQSISPRTQRNKDISTNFRRLFERHGQSSEAFRRDVENMVTFMRSQREYKVHGGCGLVEHADVRDAGAAGEIQPAD
jgi:hypothetical protein